MDIETHINRKVTAPYHSISSLYEIMKIHHIYHERIEKSKRSVLYADQSLESIPINEPLLCTKLKQNFKFPTGSVAYHPRVKSDNTIICHLGELDISDPTIHNNIY